MAKYVFRILYLAPFGCIRKHSGRNCSDREHSVEKVSGEFSSVGFVLGENIRGECEKGESSLKAGSSRLKDVVCKKTYYIDRNSII